MEGNSPEKLDITNDKNNADAIKNAEANGEKISSTIVAGKDIQQNYTPTKPQAIPMAEAASPASVSEQPAQAVPFGETPVPSQDQPDSPSRRQLLKQSAIIAATATGIAGALAVSGATASKEPIRTSPNNGESNKSPIAKFFDLFRKKEPNNVDAQKPSQPTEAAPIPAEVNPVSTPTTTEAPVENTNPPK